MLKKIFFALLFFSSISSYALDSQVAPDYFESTFAENSKSFLEKSYKEKIDQFTGRMILSYTDLSSPGNGGLDLNITRFYDPQHDAATGIITRTGVISDYEGNIGADGRIGVNWFINVGANIITDPQRINNNKFCRNEESNVYNPLLVLPDGSKESLHNISSSVYISKSRWRVECSSSVAIIYSPDGASYRLENGLKKRIVDKNGNYANFIYTTKELQTVLDRIETNDGRIIKFNYINSAIN